jgi:hypothetical protein
MAQGREASREPVACHAEKGAIDSALDLSTNIKGKEE